uniref:SCP domain-containing protein n=1 Tax=Ditylenchus dipsaci TaxID=166011 RepID=A0A915EKA8_9BILA
MQEFVNMAYYRATEVGCAVNHDCNNHSVGQDIIGHPIYPHGKLVMKTGIAQNMATRGVKRTLDFVQGLKRSVVDRQNSIRQRVIARLGEINNGPCRPTGKDFYKLHWNNNLEQRALEIASWCRKERRVNYKYIGENYFVSTDMDSHSDPRKLLKQAFRNWMHESETNALPNLDDQKKETCASTTTICCMVDM